MNKYAFGFKHADISADRLGKIVAAVNWDTEAYFNTETDLDVRPFYNGELSKEEIVALLLRSHGEVDGKTCNITECIIEMAMPLYAVCRGYESHIEGEVDEDGSLTFKIITHGLALVEFKVSLGEIWAEIPF